MLGFVKGDCQVSHLEVLHDFGGLRANAILGHDARLANELSKARTARGKGVLVFGASLGTTQVRRNGDTRSIVEEILDGRN